MENLPKHAWILCVRHNLILAELCALRARCLLFQMLSIIVSTPSGGFKADRLYLFFFCCFFAESAIKMCCTNFFFQTKVVTNYNIQTLIQNIFLSSQGFSLCPDGTIRFFGEKCFKNVLYKSFFR